MVAFGTLTQVEKRLACQPPLSQGRANSHSSHCKSDAQDESVNIYIMNNLSQFWTLKNDDILIKTLSLLDGSFTLPPLVFVLHQYRCLSPSRKMKSCRNCLVFIMWESVSNITLSFSSQIPFFGGRGVFRSYYKRHMDKTKGEGRSKGARWVWLWWGEWWEGNAENCV